MSLKNGLLSNRSNSARCICQLCNCGRHRCPLHPTRVQQNGPCHLSEYTSKYPSHPIQPVNSFKPAANAIHSADPISDQTTNRIDYIPHPLERPYQRVADVYKPNAGNFDDTTMYKKEYTEKKIPKTMAIRKSANRGVPGKFEGLPTYKSDYKKWDIQRMEHAGGVVQWQPPKDAFSGIPTYMSDYVPHRINMQHSFKPEQAAMRSDAPFDDATDYRKSYVKHPLEQRRVTEKEDWNRPSVPFEGLSTFTRDFTPKKGDVRASMKPSTEAFQSQAPFQDGTTMRTDYKPWEVERPAAYEQTAYRPPEGSMDMQTSYNTDYLKKPLVSNTVRRQEDRGRTLPPFDGSTNYQDNYKKWNIAPRQSSGSRGEYQGPGVPFEGQSTHTAHFVPHPIDVRRSFKPEQIAQKGGDFDDNTIYRTEFVPKIVEPCPAALLDSKTSRYMYRGQDESGHRFYEAQGFIPSHTSMTDLQTGQHMVSCN